MPYSEDFVRVFNDVYIREISIPAGRLVYRGESRGSIVEERIERQYIWTSNHIDYASDYCYFDGITPQPIKTIFQIKLTKTVVLSQVRTMLPFYSLYLNLPDEVRQEMSFQSWQRDNMIPLRDQVLGLPNDGVYLGTEGENSDELLLNRDRGLIEIVDSETTTVGKEDFRILCKRKWNI